MQLSAICSQYLKSNGMVDLVRVLLTVTSENQDEHILCNLSKSRGALKPGRRYRITIEEEKG
jgi:hypothetical protein